YSVIANKDIEILGEFGVGSVKEIESKNGSVYIKGGIAGKNKAVIRSSKDLYTKFISDATVYCDGTVHVGYYCLNSTIYANQLFIESAGGKIIGGSIQATQKIAVPYLGNPGEKRTRISVEGFDRKLIKTELEKQQSYMETAKLKLNKAKQLFSIYAGTIDTGSRQYAEYEAARETYFSLRDEMIALEKDLKALISCFKVKGEGEISISKKLYPNTVLEMKKLIIEIRKETLATCYFLQEGEIRKI
ncbi:MAG: DUF342 domain-containing protein, partial [Clostridiales bacterium]|nr:DUF342 domain-containing protein [Clostridiales bacterium]